MRYFLAITLIGILTGCATTDFQPYESKNNFYEGTGGTKIVVDGIDFWANGTPPRKYSIIGMVASEVGSGVGDESLIRTAVASEVKKQQGNAAIQVNNNTSFAGIIRTAPNAYMATGVKSMQFAVIWYID